MKLENLNIGYARRLQSSRRTTDFSFCFLRWKPGIAPEVLNLFQVVHFSGVRIFCDGVSCRVNHLKGLRIFAGDRMMTCSPPLRRRHKRATIGALTNIRCTLFIYLFDAMRCHDGGAEIARVSCCLRLAVVLPLYRDDGTFIALVQVHTFSRQRWCRLAKTSDVAEQMNGINFRFYALWVLLVVCLFKVLSQGSAMTKIDWTFQVIRDMIVFMGAAFRAQYNRKSMIFI